MFATSRWQKISVWNTALIEYKYTKDFHGPKDSEILWVLITSVLAYILLLALSYSLFQRSYFWVLLLAVPTHFFHARMFIVMHDCGHFSFFRSAFMNNLFGHICGFSFYTPFFMWRELHNKHHANQGNLDKRNKSLDVWTLTTEEYARANKSKRLAYRLYRNPLFLFTVAPLFFFLLIFRIPFEKFSIKAVINIFILDAFLVFFAVTQPEISLRFFFIQAPSLMIGFMMASYLFYIQHQFENTLWLRTADFSNREIALHGSSYYKLPPLLNWVYGNIGYHHLHHLDVRIPMYNLPDAQKKLRFEESRLLLSDSIKCLKMRLWNEKTRKMQGF